MILLLAGRKGSGKSLVAQEAKRRGFKEVNFADRLKQLVGTLYNWALDELYCPIKKEEVLPEPVLWNQAMAEKLAVLIDSNKPLRSDLRSFTTRREALQFIGTEVLRSVDPEFHINEFKKQVQAEGLYVCTDGRFPNEVSTIRELGGKVVYIVRPDYWDYSNHPSEVSIDRNDCDYVLVNDCSMAALLRRFGSFLDQLLSNNEPVIGKERLESLLVKHRYRTTDVALELGCSRDKIVWWATRNLVYLPGAKKYTFDSEAFHYPSNEAAYWAGLLSADGCVKKSGKCKSRCVVELCSSDRELIEGFRRFLKSDKPIYKSFPKKGKVRHYITVNDPYIVDDMKLWSIEPRKSRFNKIPSCIQHDRLLIDHWTMGLIDGDGCICIYNNVLTIVILASYEIVNFIRNAYGMEHRPIESEKGINNLFKLRLNGNDAISFYEKIYKVGFGLDRKWRKVNQYREAKVAAAL